MSLWKFNQRTFNGGQLDARLMGRTDIDKYYGGASELTNFLVKRQGCITKRRGTRLMAQVADLATDGYTAYRLIPFSYDRDGGYVLVFLCRGTANCTCRIYSRDGTLVGTLTNLPYGASDLYAIEYYQAGYTLYLAHSSYPFARIIFSTVGGVSWSYDVVNFATLGGESLPGKPVISSVDVETGTEAGKGAEVDLGYCVTAISDGIEGPPSATRTATYYSPWSDSGYIRLTIDKVSPSPEYIRIYKKVDGTWGFIGTVAAKRNSNLGTSSTATGTSEVLRDLSDDTSVGDNGNFTVAKEVENSGYGGYGYISGEGKLTFGYSSAKALNRIIVSLGKVHYVYVDGEGADARHYLQYIPCGAKYLKLTVTFADATTAEFTAAVPTGATLTDMRDSSVVGASGSTATMEKVKWIAKSLSSDYQVIFTVFGDDATDKKNVSSAVIEGYLDADCTEPATGSVTYLGEHEESGTGDYWDSVEGSPLVVSGVRCESCTVFSAYSFDDTYITPDASIQPPVIEDKFNTSESHPGSVAMYQQRLALAATNEQPFTVWFSCTGDLYNFNDHESIRSDDAIEMTLSAIRYPNVNHMVSGKDLLLFCDSGEWVVAPVSGNALTYSTVSSRVQSQIGSSRELAPVNVGSVVMFANLTNEALYAFQYSYDTEAYESIDVSILSQDIFRNNTITSVAYKQNPDSVVVLTLADGTLATLSYAKEHGVLAWSHQRLGGGMRAICCCADGSVEDGTTDVYILAKTADDRLELLRVKGDGPLTTVADAVSLDRMVTVTPAADMAVPENMQAVNTATGDVVEAGGTMTAGSTWIYGYPITAQLVTIRPEPGPNETIQFEIKNATESEIRVQAGTGFRIGAYANREVFDTPVKIDPVFDGAGGIALSDADRRALLTGTNSRDGRIRLVHDAPWPLTVLSLATTYQIEQANAEGGSK